VIVGGVVRGIWTLKRNEITVTRLGEMRRPQKAVEEEAQRLAALLGDGLRLTLRT
jgi:hypothetical protein